MNKTQDKGIPYCLDCKEKTRPKGAYELGVVTFDGCFYRCTVCESKTVSGGNIGGYLIVSGFERGK
jgi:hypothetical protein